MTTNFKSCAAASLCSLLLLLAPAELNAQLSGHNFRGDFGLKSGSQAPAGFYLSSPFARFSADSVRDRNGDVLLDGNFTLGVGFPLVSVVTKKKILGANYGFLVSQPLMNAQVDFPRFDRGSGVGLGDTYVVPINLGWHAGKADFVAGYGLFAPTGGDSQTLDMWSHEVSVGSTLYLDEAKDWHFATTAFYEMHSTKGSTDRKVGDLVTLEGGFGRSFIKKAASAGLAYTAQWKATEDSGADFPSRLLAGKNRAFSIGPEINMPFFAKDEWVGLLGFRYLWDMGNRSAFQGQTLFFSLTFARFSK